MSNNPLASACITVRVDESTDGGVVVAGLEEIHTSLAVVVVGAITQRVDSCHTAGSRNNLAVGIVLIARNCCAAAVYQPDYVALQVEDVVIVGTVALHGEGSAVRVIDKVYSYAAAGLPHHLAAVVDIICPCTLDSLARPAAVFVIR